MFFGFFGGVQVVVMVMVMIHEIFLVLCYLDDNFNNDVWALTMAVINILCMLWPLQPISVLLHYFQLKLQAVD